MACSDSLNKTWTTCPEVPPTVGWALLCQKLIKKVAHRHVHRPVCWRVHQLIDPLDPLIHPPLHQAYPQVSLFCIPFFFSISFLFLLLSLYFRSETWLPPFSLLCLFAIRVHILFPHKPGNRMFMSIFFSPNTDALYFTRELGFSTPVVNLKYLRWDLYLKQLRYLRLQPTEQGGHDALLMAQLIASIWGSTPDFTHRPSLAWAPLTVKLQSRGSILFTA